LQQRLVKTGARLDKHARYYWLLLAEGHLTRRRGRCWAGSRCYRYRRDSELVGKAAEQNQATAGLE
jgi:hypothetical protein